jgi:hypothetical protein
MVGRQKIQGVVVSTSIDTPIIDARYVYTWTALHANLTRTTMQRKESLPILRGIGEVAQVHNEVSKKQLKEFMKLKLT